MEPFGGKNEIINEYIFTTPGNLGKQKDEPGEQATPLADGQDLG